MEKYSIINKDLLTAKNCVIVHQVNCMGVMGSGVAKQIKEKYPIVYDEYMNCFKEHTKEELLGRITMTNVDCNTTVVNMFSQFGYGREKVHTDYIAMSKALNSINTYCKGRDIAFPYMIGCCRGGGDFNVVLQLICNTLTDVKSITFYRL